MYHGDIHVGDTIDIGFTTTSAATGAPTVLAGSPVISAYVGNSLTQITAGITLSVDFDGIVGYNNVRVVASGGNGYGVATNVRLVITTGTVGGTSAVGYEVGSFSIDCRGVNQILGTAVSTPATAGILDVNVKNIDNDAASASGTVTFPNATLASTTNITGGVITTVTTVTNQLTAAQVATGVWQDATAGDFTAASSIGKSLYTSGVVPGGTNGLFIAGTNAATTITTSLTTTFTGNLTGSVASVTGAVGSVTGAVGSVTGAVGSVTARVTANTDQLAGQTVTAAAGVTFPASVASPTNITAGVITTVTNLTNAATAGDFTATMKTSIGTAVAASAVASVTGAVGSVTGAVGSVTARVTANTDQLAGQTVTAAAGVTFPTSVASPTNITGGVITTVTTLTNAPSDSSGVTTLLSRIGGSITISGGIVSADIKKVNAVTVNGNGAGTPWGP